MSSWFGKLDLSAAQPYFIPIVVRILGFSSPDARTSWQAEQSLVMVWPSALVWLPSWQRKQPGESLCPMLFGCVPQVIRMSGKTLRR
jgi:hypothetical protein